MRGSQSHDGAVVSHVFGGVPRARRDVFCQGNPRPLQPWPCGDAGVRAYHALPTEPPRRQLSAYRLCGSVLHLRATSVSANPSLSRKLHTRL